MKTLLKIALVLGTLAATAPAFALDPCAPTVRAQDSYMSCTRGSTRYDIVIQTMMSPITAECPYEKNVEVSTAQIKVKDRSNLFVEGAQITVRPGFFTYDSDVTSGSFSSPLLSLELENCQSPLRGGLTGGN